MMRLLIAVSLLGCAVSAFAQPKLPGVPNTGERAPNDQVEGTIFEWYSVKQKSGEEKKEIKGKFRLEKKAVFDVSPRLALPSKKEVEKKVIEPIKKGDALNIRLPEGPQQKRLGEYTNISGGKVRINFNDKESLHGLMIIWKKKDTDDVWFGTYTEKEGAKTTAEWDVELRPIQD